MTGKLLHLQCIKGWYRYRRRWPKRVRNIAKGDAFLHVLGTSDLQEALRQRPRIELLFQAEVAKLEHRIDEVDRQLSQHEVERLFARWLHRESTVWESGQPKQYTDQLHAECVADFVEFDKVCRRMLGMREFRDIEHEVRSFLVSEGISAQSDHPGYNKLVEYVVRGWRELAQQHLAWLEGSFDYRFQDRVVVAAAETGPRATSITSTRTIGELIAQYRRDKEAGWARSTVAAYEPVFRLMVDVFGRSRDIASIGREEGRLLFEMVKALPKNLTKMPEFKGQPIAKCIAIAQAKGLRAISPKTINGSYMCFLRSIFQWAVNEQWMDANPFNGLTVPDPVDPRDKRDPFSASQLNKIFSLSPWAEGAKENDIRFWGPLVALFSGMRRGEIAQLLTTDIKVIRGIPCFEIRADDRKRVKTSNARRVVPIHPELQRVGFLQFVERRRHIGDAQLFAGENPNTNGQWGDGFGDWFNRLLASNKINGKRLGMHSFRHNFEDALREAGLHAMPIGQYLTGRSRGGDASSDYGAGYSTSTLADAIAKVSYPDLDISHLHIGDVGPDCRAAIPVEFPDHHERHLIAA